MQRLWGLDLQVIVLGSNVLTQLSSVSRTLRAKFICLTKIPFSKWCGFIPRFHIPRIVQNSTQKASYLLCQKVSFWSKASSHWEGPDVDVSEQAVRGLCSKRTNDKTRLMTNSHHETFILFCLFNFFREFSSDTKTDVCLVCANNLICK